MPKLDVPYKCALLTDTLPESLTVTSDELDDFEFYAQYAAAAYCNSAVAAGTPITCGGASGECPTLETDGVTAVSSFQ